MRYPGKRQFNFDPREEAKENRAELVVAGLTILRAYISTGRPLKLDKIGSFEHWNIIREVLIWLGKEDPANTRERIMADDPQKGELADLLHLWWTALKDQRKTLAELKNMAEQNRDSPVAELAEILSAKSRNGMFNARSIGKFLAKQVDRIVGGYVLHSKLDSSGTKLYWAIKAEEPKGMGSENQEMPF